MSQTAVFIKINGNVVNDVLSYVPDREEMIQICKDEGYDENSGDISNYLWIEYTRYEIGEGESGIDTFFNDEILLHLYNTTDFEDVIENQMGMEISIIDQGDEDIGYEELSDLY